MTATTIDLQVAVTRPVPQGAQMLGALAARVLEAAGNAIDVVRRAQEHRAAERLLRMARHYDASQPGFASDLRAAVNRHQAD